METLDLERIRNGFPGITPVFGTMLLEACLVCLEKLDHKPGTVLSIFGDWNAEIELRWNTVVDEQMRRTWSNQNETTEFAAVCLVVFARLGYDPRDRDRVYTDADKMREIEKALELEKQAIALVQARYNQTQDDNDKLTESIYSRSAAWIAIKAELFDEAEKIALTALARGAHPEEKAKLLDALFTASQKQGYRLRSLEKENMNTTVTSIEDRELAGV